MNLPYTLRLLCLCFASFFLIHAVLGLGVFAAAPGAMRRGESMRPGSAARLLLALRLLPVTLGALAVAGLCIPSYLWLETNEARERVGLACCAMALLGVLVWAKSVLRTARAGALSLRYSRRAHQGQPEPGGHSLPLTVLNSRAPVLALAGVMRPRVIVSRRVLETLSAEELEAALAHERAHRKSGDNLKRLALLLAPDILPFWRPLARLDRCWARWIEWAADDEASGGDSRRAVSLAAALVHMARMGAAPAPSPLTSSFLGNDRDFSARVNRLLGLAPARALRPRRTRVVWPVAVGLGAALVVAAIVRPATFLSVHHLLEQLLR